jgi:hypothetical protein
MLLAVTYVDELNIQLSVPILAVLHSSLVESLSCEETMSQRSFSMVQFIMALATEGNDENI